MPKIVPMASKRPVPSAATGSPVKRRKKAYCHFKTDWKKQEFTIKFEGAERTVSGNVLSGVEGVDNAKCMACGVTFSVRHGGANDVVKHSSLLFGNTTKNMAVIINFT